MHNIKDIRKNFDDFENSLKKRFINLDIKKIKTLDDNNRELIQKKEILEKEKKEISKSKNKTLFEKSKDISLEIIKSKIGTGLDERRLNARILNIRLSIN